MPHTHETMPSAIWYNRMARLFRGSYRRVAADAVLDVPQGASVLDIGAGTGQLLEALARIRPDLHLTGLDVDPDMVALANDSLPGVGVQATVVVGDVADLPFDDDRFDLVVSSLSLHHWGEPTTGAKEIERVRKPAGSVRIYDFGFAPFEAFAATTQTATSGDLARVRISPLPWPTLVRLDS